LALRQFGYYPDVSLWEPGDLLLFHAITPQGASSEIMKTLTAMGWGPEDAMWYHAAAYVGEDCICEATRQGVKYHRLYSYVGPDHVIKVMRDKTLTPQQRYAIGIQMMARLHQNYDFLTAIALKIGSLTGGGWRALTPQFRAQRRACVCSQLYADAYLFVTGRLLNRHTREIVPTPAALNSSPYLTEVHTPWLQLST
jgi:hypothetical protein